MQICVNNFKILINFKRLILQLVVSPLLIIIWIMKRTKVILWKFLLNLHELENNLFVWYKFWCKVEMNIHRCSTKMCLLSMCQTMLLGEISWAMFAPVMPIKDPMDISPFQYFRSTHILILIIVLVP